MTWQLLRGSWRERQQPSVTLGKLAWFARTEMKGWMTPVLSVWRMVKHTAWLSPLAWFLLFVCNTLSLTFRKLCQTLVCFITESIQPICKLQLSGWSRLILQGTASAICILYFYASRDLLRPFPAPCSAAFMLAVTVRKVRRACVPSSPPTLERVHHMESSWQTGERTCVVGIYFNFK